MAITKHFVLHAKANKSKSKKKKIRKIIEMDKTVNCGISTTKKLIDI